MKRMIGIVLALVLLLSLAACGGTAASDPSVPASAPAAAAEHLPAPVSIPESDLETGIPVDLPTAEKKAQVFEAARAWITIAQVQEALGPADVHLRDKLDWEYLYYRQTADRPALYFEFYLDESMYMGGEPMKLGKANVAFSDNFEWMRLLATPFTDEAYQGLCDREHNPDYEQNAEGFDLSARMAMGSLGEGLAYEYRNTEGGWGGDGWVGAEVAYVYINENSDNLMIRYLWGGKAKQPDTYRVEMFLLMTGGCYWPAMEDEITERTGSDYYEVIS